MAFPYNRSTDSLLSVVFMLLAVGAMVLFFVYSNRTPFWVVGGIAIVLRLVQYLLRFISKRKGAW